MKLTDRDRKLARDISLSHVLSRDQTLRLGYFGSVTRANTRLRGLVHQGFLQVLATPYHGQFLYGTGRKARDIVGDRIAMLLQARKPTPQFVQHALAVTDVRIALAAQGLATWRFEQQVRHGFSHRGRTVDLRPDGLAVSESRVVFVEVDLGHTAREKWKQRLEGYRAFLKSGEFEGLFGRSTFEVLVVTTGDLRSRHIAARATGADVPLFRVVAAKELGVTLSGGWS